MSLIRFLIHLRFLAWVLFDSVVLLFPAGRTQLQRIAVIRLDRIGDAVLWLPSAYATRRAFPAPAWRVELIVTSAASGILRESGQYDSVWTIDPERMRRNPIYRLRILWRMRRGGWSEVVQPVSSRCISDGDTLVRISGAKSRIGAADDFAITPVWLSRWADRWYTRIIPTFRSGRHELDRNAAFTDAWAGVKVDSAPRLTIKPEPPVPSPYAVIAPGAHWPGRCWPHERFAEIASRIQTTWGWTIVLAGSSAERSIARSMMDAAPGVAFLDQTGTNSPRGMAAVLAGAQIVITNDTATVHLAAAVGVPAVAVAGGGHVGRFLPYPTAFDGRAPTAVFHQMPCFGCDWRCIHHPQKGMCMPCIEAVTVDSVWIAILGEMGRRN